MKLEMQESWPRPHSLGRARMGAQASLTLRPPCCFSVVHTFDLRTRGHQNYVALIFKKLQIELPYHLAVLLLGIHPKEIKTLTQKDTCTPMFIAALFTTAKTWKQPKCPSMDEWIKKWWHIYMYMCVYTHTHTHTHTQWNVTQPFI